MAKKEVTDFLRRAYLAEMQHFLDDHPDDVERLAEWMIEHGKSPAEGWGIGVQWNWWCGRPEIIPTHPSMETS